MTANGSAAEVCQEDAQIVDLEARTWLQKHCRGDEQAFTHLIEKYRKPVYGYLTKCGIDQSNRDDLFQEIFLKVHHAADTYQPNKPLSPWIFTIVVNTVRNHFRSEHNRKKVVSIQPEPGELVSNVSPERNIANEQLLHWLEKEIHKLPLPQKEVILLTTIKGMRLHEVAQTLGIPINTAKTCLRRARQKLIEKMTDESSSTNGEAS